MTATTITAYLGEGLAANRPATPAIAAGAIGLWYSTDTDTYSIYNGSAWAGPFVIPGGTTGQVLEKNSNTDFDYSWATPSSGSSANTWAIPLASANWAFDSGAHATKGNSFIPTLNMTIDRVQIISDGGNNGHTLQASLWVLNTGTNALTSQVGSSYTTTGPASTGPANFTITSPWSLTAGTAYVLLITDTTGSATNSIDLPVQASTMRPTYPQFPSRLDSNTIDGAGGCFQLSSNSPAASNTLSASSNGVFGIMFRFQV